MEENNEEFANEAIPETPEVVASPKTRKPRARKSTEAVIEQAIEIPVAEENQEEPFLEELDSLIELEPKKDKKKKKNKKKEKEKKKAKKAKEKAKAKEKKAKAKAKKAKKNKKNKSKKK